MRAPKALSLQHNEHLGHAGDQPAKSISLSLATPPGLDVISFNKNYDYYLSKAPSELNVNSGNSEECHW